MAISQETKDKNTLILSYLSSISESIANNSRRIALDVPVYRVIVSVLPDDDADNVPNVKIL